MSETICQSCGGSGGHVETSDEGGVHREHWVPCRDCGGRGTMITREFEGRVRRVQDTDIDAPVKVTLSYDAATDPFAVQAIFTVSSEEDRVWHFSRQLLAIGAISLTQYGYGDVRFRYLPLMGLVLMCLNSHDGHCHITLPQEEVLQFLTDTHEASRITDSECDALVDEFLKELFDA